MVEETANQPTNPADEEYEYEYIELAEGEELPEGAEYEYEYVEVPADEAAAVVSGNGADLSSGEKMTATAEADVPAVEISSDTGAEEDIPQFFREDAAQENAPVEPHVVYEPVSAADESGEIIEEPRFEIGLPGEDAEESLRQAPLISSLPLDILKIHQMQIIRGTRLAQEYAEHPFHVYTVEEYIDVIVKYIRLLRKDLVLERFVSQSPKELLIAPKWGLKNYEFTNLLNNRLKSLQ